MSFLVDDKKIIDEAMDVELSLGSSNSTKIIEGMRYSALGGKRLRGILTIEFAKMFDCGINDALPYAVAVECIQAYSLIHDDLPCMDNDDVRRGKPSCHIAFGEANALLSGDALLTHAFCIISKSDIAKKYPERAVNAVRTLSEMAGYKGMVGGQVLDLEAAEHEVDGESLTLIHRLKTCALIKAAVLMGCHVSGAENEVRNLSESFAEEFGMAFQIIDDILDFDGNYCTCELNSYVKVHGLEKAREDAGSHIKSAKQILKTLTERKFDTSNLNELLDFLSKRMN